ncbi:SCO family protein [Dyella terrae]|uniref:SCO family protein n=2 Tax=Dyella TaxID=231454 RepID=A0A4R0Z1R9_9GAMM|nr:MULTISPECIES: SCO family protein [Dyella]TBR40776.1 SCO family protein [Dyella terrae]TCI13749.1 SCO family protein [Dyella soli]
MKRLLFLLASLLLAAPVLADQKPLPGDSVYQLGIKLTDQDGHTWPLAERRGRVQLVTMFYSSCTMVCPMIIDTMKATRATLDDASKQKLDLLAVSFDPERDTVDALHAYMGKRKLDAPRWTLARAKPQDVRALSALLGLQYRQLPDGEFNHSSELILLDADGRILAKTTVIGKVDPAFAAKVKEALR